MSYCGRIHEVLRRTLLTSCLALLAVGLAAADTGIQALGGWRLGPAVVTCGNDTVLYVGAGATLLTYDITDRASPQLTSELVFDTEIEDMTLEGAVLVGVGEGGLATLDLSDPLQPALMGLHEFMWRYELRLTMGDGYAITADMSGQIEIFDLADPYDPQLASTGFIGGEFGTMAYMDQVLYVFERDNGMAYAFDLSDPYAVDFPEFLMCPDYMVDHGVLARDGLFYVLFESGYVRIMELDGDQLISLGTLPGSGVEAIAMNGDQLLLAAGGEFHVYDISVPGVATETASCQETYGDPLRRIDWRGTHLSGIDVEGRAQLFDAACVPAAELSYGDKTDHGALLGDVYVTGAMECDRLSFFDVADPSAPVLLGTLDMPANVGGLKAADGLCLVGCYDHGVVVVDPSSGPPFAARDTLAIPGFVRGMTAHDGVAYIASTNNVVKSYDLAVPGGAVLLGSLATNSYAWDLHATDDHLVLTQWNLLECYDLSDPGALQLLDSLPVNGQRIAASGDRLYVSLGANGLTTVRLSTAGVLTQLGTYDPTEYISEIVAMDDRVYAGSYMDGLYVYDVSNPYAVAPLDVIEVAGGVRELCMRGRLLAVTSGACGFTLLRDDVVTPVQLAGFAAQRVRDGALLSWNVSAPGGLYHVWRGETSTDRVRLTTTPVGGSDRIEWLDEAASADGAAYWLEDVSTADASLWFGPVVLAAAPTAGRVVVHDPWPNPFNPSVSLRVDLPRPLHLAVTVHDLRGRRVATLADGERGAGPVMLQWNGCDDRGRGLESGTYFARLTAGETVSVCKLLLVR